MTKNGRMASHLPLLTRAFDVSEGDVLEVGTGYFSTTLLHWLGAITGRKIVSYETDQKWFERAKRYQCEYHDIFFVTNWSDIPFEKKHWGLAFIDQHPHLDRSISIARLQNCCDYIVAHDTEPRSEKLYGYPNIYHLFKYRYDDKRTEPWTTILSNFHSLEKLFTHENI